MLGAMPLDAGQPSRDPSPELEAKGHTSSGLTNQNKQLNTPASEQESRLARLGERQGAFLARLCGWSQNKEVERYFGISLGYWMLPLAKHS